VQLCLVPWSTDGFAHICLQVVHCGAELAQLLAAEVGEFKCVAPAVGGVLAAGDEAGLDQLVHDLGCSKVGDGEVARDVLLRARSELVDRRQRGEVANPQAEVGHEIVAASAQMVEDLGDQVADAGVGRRDVGRPEHRAEQLAESLCSAVRGSAGSRSPHTASTSCSCGTERPARKTSAAERTLTRGLDLEVTPTDHHTQRAENAELDCGVDHHASILTTTIAAPMHIRAAGRVRDGWSRCGAGPNDECHSRYLGGRSAAPGR